LLAPLPRAVLHARVIATLDVRILSVVAIAAAMVALVQTVRLWWRGAAAGWRLRTRAERAAEGERDAEPLVVARGYTIVARQVTRRWRVAIDEHAVDVTLRADLVVERGGRFFVADVKTGAMATRIENVATRRQLLEYRCAFDVDGVLLVDADRGSVHEIGFALPAEAAPRAPSAAWVPLVLGFVVGAAAAWALFGR
jgi:hypothetical protein